MTQLEYILNGIQKKRELNDGQFVNHLSSLKPHLNNLWDSYQHSDVSVNYITKEIQECYMLRYYPLYFINAKNFLYKILDSIELSQLKEFKVIIFGMGPGPELAALSNLIWYFYEEKEKFQNLEKVSIIEIDHYSNQWEYSRALHSYVEYGESQRKFKERGIKFMLSVTSEGVSEFLNSNPYIINNYNLIYAQNFFNEALNGIDSNQFVRILKNKKSECSFFASSDRVGYNIVNNFFNRIYNSINSSYLINDSNVHIRLQQAIPDILLEELFDGQPGRIASRNAYSDWRLIKID
jgi:hypothetical protein